MKSLQIARFCLSDRTPTFQKRMGLLGKAVRIHDVENAEAFVQRTIDKSGIDYSPHEREELLAEGLTILYELAGKYKPLPATNGQPGGRFSGYAAMFLPRRLGDAWHKLHPEHRYVTDPETGKRGWVYGPPMISLDGLMRTTDNYGDHGTDRQFLHARSLNAFCHATRAATIAVLSRTAPRAA